LPSYGLPVAIGIAVAFVVATFRKNGKKDDVRLEYY